MQMGILNHDDFLIQGSLGRHETFAPRYGWLKKGYEAVRKDSNVFKATNAIEKLGVGKNMVSSIRYWCQAFNLIETRDDGLGGSDLGNRLLDDNGWDPYLEDMASLWLLHWQLFVPPLEAVSWSLAFNKCTLWSFDIKQLTKIIISAAQKYPRFSSVSEKTFERDASCIIRMYAEGLPEKESEIDCPFTQLGIISTAEEKNTFRFDNSGKQTIPELIFAAVCFSYIDNYTKGQKTIALSRLTYDFNSPGVIFKVPESVVGSYLFSAAKKLSGFEVSDNMGNMQLHFAGEPGQIYWNALQEYYKEHK